MDPATLIFVVRDEQILLIRKSENAVVAINPECRHEKCQVLYQKDWGEIRCKCHGSKYTLDGKVINPPATKDLFYYPVKLKDQRILLILEATDPDAAE